MCRLTFLLRLRLLQSLYRTGCLDRSNVNHCPKHTQACEANAKMIPALILGLAGTQLIFVNFFYCKIMFLHLDLSSKSGCHSLSCWSIPACVPSKSYEERMDALLFKREKENTVTVSHTKLSHPKLRTLLKQFRKRHK